MKASQVLSGLYPPAIRQHWGDDTGREVAESGIRAWPDTIVGAGRLWLRPGDWPETAPGQTRRGALLAMWGTVPDRGSLTMVVVLAVVAAGTIRAGRDLRGLAG